MNDMGAISFPPTYITLVFECQAPMSIVLSKELIEKEQIKDIYSIVFWCRSWLDAGWIEKQLGSDTKERLRIYTGIIENALYYLLENNVEEAFWAYNEFLDGRYY